MSVEDIDESVSISAYGCLESSVHRRQGTQDQVAIGIEQFSGNKTSYEGLKNDCIRKSEEEKVITMEI